MADEPAREIEVEILPPGDTPHARRPERSADGPRVYTTRPNQEAADSDPVKPAEFEDPLIALVARLMDSVFVVPGTNLRFGFDPLIGLLAGYGDAAAAVTSLFLLFRSLRYGVPRIVLAQMAWNIVLNATVGAVPIVGDAFSFWFKSNERNYELLRKHAGGKATPANWVFVAGISAAIAVILLFSVLASLAYVSAVVFLMKYLGTTLKH
jgi:hypothetical protein